MLHASCVGGSTTNLTRRLVCKCHAPPERRLPSSGPWQESSVAPRAAMRPDDPPHGAQSAPWGPRRSGATSAERGPVRVVHGGVQYREYLNEEQRSHADPEYKTECTSRREAHACVSRYVVGDRVHEVPVRPAASRIPVHNRARHARGASTPAVTARCF
jgi:hypothetical protein